MGTQTRLQLQTKPGTKHPIGCPRLRLTPTGKGPLGNNITQTECDATWRSSAKAFRSGTEATPVSLMR